MGYQKLKENGVPFSLTKREDRNGVLFFRYRYNGKFSQKSTGESNQKKAIQVARKYLSGLPSEIPHHNPVEGSGRHLLTDRVAEYLLETKRLCKPSTRVRNTRYLSYYAAAMGNPVFGSITEAQAQAGLNTLYNTKQPSVAYWIALLGAVLQLFKWCRLKKYFLSDPFLGYPRPKGDQIEPCDTLVEPWEFEAVLTQGTPKERLMWLVLRYTGIYPSDFFVLYKNHFKFDADGTMLLNKKREKATSNKQVYNQPLDGRVEEAVKRQWELCAPNEKLFVKHDTRCYNTWYSDMHRKWNTAWKAALGEPVKQMKALRHTFATEHIERGVPEDVLLPWMGHSPGSTILRRHYLHRKSTTRYRYVETSSTPIVLSL